MAPFNAGDADQENEEFDALSVSDQLAEIIAAAADISASSAMRQVIQQQGDLVARQMHDFDSPAIRAAMQMADSQAQRIASHAAQADQVANSAAVQMVDIQARRVASYVEMANSLNQSYFARLADDYQSHLQSLALSVFDPAIHRLSMNSDGAAALVSRIVTEQKSAFARVPAPRRSDTTSQQKAIEEALESPEIAAAVKEVVESDPVRELVAQLDADAVSPIEAQDAQARATEAATAQRVGGFENLSPGQIVTILVTLEIMIVAAVCSAYGYDVGRVSDVLTWPLAFLQFRDVLEKLGLIAGDS